jgi:hypothetical protein
MKKTLHLWLVLLVAAASFLALTQCDDDDDDSGGTSACQKFCSRLADCGLGGLIGIATMDDCLNYCDTSVDGTLGNCVNNAGDCAVVEACFGAPPDDDDDDDDNDDNDTPDPTPRITGQALYLSALDYDLPSEKTGGYDIGIHEWAFFNLEFRDEDCDLPGGEMYYSLDDGADTLYDEISGLVKCSDSQMSFLWGYELTEIDGALAEGEHTLRFYIVDDAGHQSNERSVHYEVDDFPTAIGAPMADFTLTDETGTPVSLSDYAGMIVLINGFAEWCTYCKQEADEMAELIAEYNGAGDPVAMLGLMHETNSGSSDIPQATLQDWSDDHGWGGLIPCLDDGDPPTVQEDYWWTPAFPFNMILDADHVIRVKWHGYGSGLIEDVIDWLLEG